MNLKKNFHENSSRRPHSILKSYDNPDHKINIWNTFVDSDNEGLEGIHHDDFSIIPRLIPESYLPVIEKTCKDITTFLMKVISLPEEEVKAIVPEGPVRDFLIDEIGVLKHRKKRMVGSFRFDMAVVGKPDANHPPQLLEVNEIGFDGLARSSYFQNTLLTHMPELKKHVRALDTAAAEVRNMNRLGKHIVRLQHGCYNWDEQYLKMTSDRMGSHLHLISPTQYKQKVNKKHFPLLEELPFSFPNGKLLVGKKLKPDAMNMSFAYTLKDLKRDKELYKKMVASKTPQYGPLVTGLIATKSVLVMLADEELRKRFLGSADKLSDSILPAFQLKGNVDKVLAHPDRYVIKHTDGFGGQQVFGDQQMLKLIKSMPEKKYHEWIVQKKTRLNVVHVNGILSHRRKAIGDLGVFVQYDWENGKFNHFEIGGLMCRATSKSIKVNVSAGGTQVAVMLEKGV
ncbi:MAG: hypothetical protein ACJ76H_12070 [Bacteriovoracaceae bacterium]